MGAADLQVITHSMQTDNTATGLDTPLQVPWTYMSQHRKTQQTDTTAQTQQHRLISHNTDKHNSTDLHVTTQVDTTQVRHNSTDFHVTTQKDTTQIDTVA